MFFQYQKLSSSLHFCTPPSEHSLFMLKVALAQAATTLPTDSSALEHICKWLHYLLSSLEYVDSDELTCLLLDLKPLLITFLRHSSVRLVLLSLRVVTEGILSLEEEDDEAYRCLKLHFLPPITLLCSDPCVLVAQKSLEAFCNIYFGTSELSDKNPCHLVTQLEPFIHISASDIVAPDSSSNDEEEDINEQDEEAERLQLAVCRIVLHALNTKIMESRGVDFEQEICQELRQHWLVSIGERLDIAIRDAFERSEWVKVAAWAQVFVSLVAHHSIAQRLWFGFHRQLRICVAMQDKAGVLCTLLMPSPTFLNFNKAWLVPHRPPSITPSASDDDGESFSDLEDELEEEEQVATRNTLLTTTTTTTATKAYLKAYDNSVNRPSLLLLPQQKEEERWRRHIEQEITPFMEVPLEERYEVEKLLLNEFSPHESLFPKMKKHVQSEEKSITKARESTLSLQRWCVDPYAKMSVRLNEDGGFLL